MMHNNKHDGFRRADVIIAGIFLCAAVLVTACLTTEATAQEKALPASKVVSTVSGNSQDISDSHTSSRPDNLRVAQSELSSKTPKLPAGKPVGHSNPIAAEQDTNWPGITNQHKPWNYWLWMGSAVDDKNLTRQLKIFQEAGLGGVHIIPIYGAKGYEDRFIEYLSPQWMDRLSHTIREARRLGMDVDMTMGTGWCFGGPSVEAIDANSEIVCQVHRVLGGRNLDKTFDPHSTQALVAYGNSGDVIDLTDAISSSGRLNWTAPEGVWDVYHICQKPSDQLVKRPAPGGEGYMLNPLSKKAMTRYLMQFDNAFGGYGGLMPRAMYHDSYEYRSNWSPELFDEFEKRCGYRLQTQLPALMGHGAEDVIARVKSDYRRTVSEIIAGGYIGQWTAWARAKGMKTRNQAHGSPGNLLDIYAAAAIPETEMFRKDRDPLVSKFASSAAHVMNKRLVSSETGTWLKEHFNAALADLKYLLDDLFLSGINHVFYHGTAYSPDDAAWPGWLFYASTQMNPRNAIWRDVPTLNAYVARCQLVLQSSRPDNDILLYWPISDLWNDADNLVQELTVHRTGWLHDQAIGRVAQRFWDRGWAFDYISDTQLGHARATADGIAVPGGNYKVVVVPHCKLMPEETLARLLDLAKSGATVIFQRELPTDVPGYGDLDRRRATFKNLLSAVEPKPIADKPVAESVLDQGRFLVGDVEAALEIAGVERETFVDNSGLKYVRLARDGGYDYFIANRGCQAPIDAHAGNAPEPIAGTSVENNNVKLLKTEASVCDEDIINQWIELSRPAKSVLLMNPLTGNIGAASIRRNENQHTEVLLNLRKGESIIVRTFTDKDVDTPAWPYLRPAGNPIEITGKWQVDFIQGGPDLPKSFTTKKLASWTDLDDAAKRFAGTALYRIIFDAPPGNPELWMLDLGKVCQSARIKLNGQPLGTTIIAPHQVPITQLQAKDNVLEIEVTNLSANRLRDLDIRGIEWKNFYDINFVNIDYKTFDASTWPIQDSGLLNPATLCPMVKMRLEEQRSLK